MSQPHINVTPLIDVLLVLLIIFMVISPMKPSAFKASVPQEPRNTDGVKNNPDTLVVTIERDAAVGMNEKKNLATVDDTKGLIAELERVFGQRAENMNTERTVFIKAPKSAAYGEVAKVVDAVKISGAAPISLQLDGLN